MRKTTLAIAGACVVASLLFFLAPAFRQAFQVSLTQWQTAFVTKTFGRQPGFGALARRAEQQHDAEGIAFVAIHEWAPAENARLADEAVSIDPNLTWVYAVVAVRHSELPEIDGWIPQIELRDPQNALPYLLVAERIDNEQVHRAGTLHERVPDEPSAAWRDALANAFQSEKLDPYLDRLGELDRRVLLRYAVDDPYEADLDEYWRGLPSYGAWDSFRYAESLLKSGATLEAQGDRNAARENYLTVARYGNMLGWPGRFPMSRPLQDAYTRLAALSQQEGNQQQARFYTDLATSTGRDLEEQIALLRQRWTGGAVTRWDAAVVRASGLMMLFFASLTLICIATVAAKSRSFRLGSLRASRGASAFLIGSVSGMLLSSAMLYVAYRPYAEMFRNYVHYGDESRIQDLSDFLSYTQMPLGVKDVYQLRDFMVYFWCCFTALCLIALALMVLRHFKNRPRPIPIT